MNSTLPAVAPPPLVLHAETAEELMSPNPLSVRDDATVAEVIAVLTDRGISAVPVIDDAGRAIGVVSRGDIVAHEREMGALQQAPDPTRARDIMTPVVFSVFPESPAAQVVSEMVRMNVQRLFVMDHDSIIVGLISALDVLRHLGP